MDSQQKGCGHQPAYDAAGFHSIASGVIVPFNLMFINNLGLSFSFGVCYNDTNWCHILSAPLMEEILAIPALVPV
jgi:hypothetical protein